MIFRIPMMMMVSLTAAAAQIGDDDFINLCIPTIKPAQQATAVCQCIWTDAVLSIEDQDLRAAALRGYKETGIFTIKNEWLPILKRGQAASTLERILPAISVCMSTSGKRK